MAADERRYGYYGEDAPGFPAWLRERGLGPGTRVPVPSRFSKIAVSGPIAERGGIVEYRLAAKSLEMVREECRRLFGERRKRRGIALRGRPLAAAAAALASGEDAGLPLADPEGDGWPEGEPLPDGDLEELGLGEEGGFEEED
ncbi:hypothetical protein [Desulfovirgula thermocuniculi]|uniref:hypothetical protein n=1 Tax=Desulfovirgula thermocuniculi TaxID=348842 RepID=UPI0003FBE821|nr:hypothetical protein [Desulfovirgula thermocuniculi]